MNDIAAKSINYRQFYENVKTHVENLCTDRMRTHAGADVSHDLDVQVFRILGGYEEALKERDTLAARNTTLEAIPGRLRNLCMELSPEPNGEWSLWDTAAEKVVWGKSIEEVIEAAESAKRSEKKEAEA